MARFTRSSSLYSELPAKEETIAKMRTIVATRRLVEPSAKNLWVSARKSRATANTLSIIRVRFVMVSKNCAMISGTLAFTRTL